MPRRLVRRRGLSSPAPRGERAISRKPLAQGMPDCSAYPLMTCVCSFLPSLHARPRVRVGTRHSLRPLNFGGEQDAKLGHLVPRECWRSPRPRHCEERSDEAIHGAASGGMDCFAEPVIGPRFARTRWLAMTRRERSRIFHCHAPDLIGASSIPEAYRFKHSRLWNTGSPGRAGRRHRVNYLRS